MKFSLRRLAPTHVAPRLKIVFVPSAARQSVLTQHLATCEAECRPLERCCQWNRPERLIYGFSV